MNRETKTKKFEAPKTVYAFAASVTNTANANQSETTAATISFASSCCPG